MFKNKPVDITRLSINAFKNLKEEEYSNKNTNENVESEAMKLGRD